MAEFKKMIPSEVFIERRLSANVRRGNPLTTREAMTRMMVDENHICGQTNDADRVTVRNTITAYDFETGTQILTKINQELAEEQRALSLANRMRHANMTIVR